MKMPQSAGSIASLWAVSSPESGEPLRERLRLRFQSLSPPAAPDVPPLMTARVLAPSVTCAADPAALRRELYPGLSDDQLRQVTGQRFPEPRTLGDCCALYAERVRLGLPDTNALVGLCAHYFAHRLFGAAISHEELDFFDCRLWPALLTLPADYETVCAGLRKTANAHGVMVSPNVASLPLLLGWEKKGIDPEKADSLIDEILNSF